MTSSNSQTKKKQTLNMGDVLAKETEQAKSSVEDETWDNREDADGASSVEDSIIRDLQERFISYMGSYLFSLLTALLLTLTVEMPFENFWKRVKRIIMEPPGKRVNADAPVSSMLNQNSVLNQNIGNKNCELTPSLVLNVPEVNLDVEEKNIIGDSVQYTMKL